MKKLKKYFEQKFFKINTKNLLGFAFLWLTNGFFLGTLTLLGPVEYISAWARKNNYNQNIENLLIKVIIVLFVVFSFVISVWLLKRIIKSSSASFRIIAYVTCFCLACAALFLLLNPKIINTEVQMERALGDTQFTLGAYPTEEKLEELEENDFTTVICLMHPAIVPFEAVLINQEKELATKIGLKFINIPMLPWISDNEQAIAKVKMLMKNKNEKYYMHCYLGKDRVNVMKRIILSEKAGVNEEVHNSNRPLDTYPLFERGKVIVLSKSSVYFTPYPTDEEFFSFIVGGEIKQVVSLLNLDNPEDLILINKEKDICEKYKINFKQFNLNERTSDAIIRKYIKEIKLLPKPLIIHNFKSDDVSSKRFIALYN